jgi:anti-anti-sigma factor
MESVVVFELMGRMVAGDGEGRLTDAVTVCLQTGQRQILLNCSGLTSVDSSGLGEVVESHVAARGQGGRLVLTGVSRRFTQLLATVGLLGILEVQESEKAGLESLAERPLVAHVDSAFRRVSDADKGQSGGIKWQSQSTALAEAFTA